MLWEKYKKPGKKFSFIGMKTIHILLNKKKKLYWFYKTYDRKVSSIFFIFSSKKIVQI